MTTHAYCSNCGTKLAADARYCDSCGERQADPAPAPADTAPAPADAAPAPVDPAWEKLKPKLDKAAADVRAALAEAEAGNLDEETLRKRLFDAGHFVHERQAWMLDLENSRWASYDGFEVRLTPFDPS